jgi:hypothetical protein
MSIANLFDSNSYDLIARSLFTSTSINTLGNIGCAGLVFNAEVLNDYQVYTLGIGWVYGSQTFGGNARVVKIGKFVNLNIVPFSLTSTNASTFTTNIAILPVDSRPYQNVETVATMLVGANTIGVRCVVLTTGNVQISSSAVSGANLLYGQNFPASGTISLVNSINISFQVV